MQDSENKSQSRSSQRWILPTLAVLFLGPLLAAWLFYFAESGWRPGGQVNHGRLLESALALPAINPANDRADSPMIFRDTWTLAVVGNGPCDERCTAVIDKSRRVRLALRQKAPRVRRALVYRSSQTGKSSADVGQDTGLDFISVGEAQGQLALETFRLAGGDSTPPWAVFVVDPLGNIIMVFGPDFEMRGMLADLKRLLKLSRIG